MLFDLDGDIGWDLNLRILDYVCRNQGAFTDGLGASIHLGNPGSIVCVLSGVENTASCATGMQRGPSILIYYDRANLVR